MQFSGVLIRIIIFVVLGVSLFFVVKSSTMLRTPSIVTKNIPTPASMLLPIAIPVLQNRIYIPSAVTTVQRNAGGGAYTSSIISYTVDGLTEYALLSIPSTQKPVNGFPIVFIDHGYIIPSQYSTIGSYATEVSFFASRGYVVVKPDYRGNGSSQGANDPLQRYNYPMDVLTLLASLKNIPGADVSHVYLWGHSMGGEVTLEVLEILGVQKNFPIKVRAAVLWAPVTDPAKWFSRSNLQHLPEAQLTPFPYVKTFQILGQPSEASPTWQSINPLNYLSSINAPIQLNHGTADGEVPYSYSVELNSKLKAQGKPVEFISYPDADHNLSPDTFQALQNNLLFFQAHR